MLCQPLPKWQRASLIGRWIGLSVNNKTTSHSSKSTMYSRKKSLKKLRNHFPELKKTCCEQALSYTVIQQNTYSNIITNVHPAPAVIANFITSVACRTFFAVNWFGSVLYCEESRLSSMNELWFCTLQLCPWIKFQPELPRFTELLLYYMQFSTVHVSKS